MRTGKTSLCVLVARLCTLCGIALLLPVTEWGSFATEGTAAQARLTAQDNKPRKSAFSIWVDQGGAGKALQNTGLRDVLPFSVGQNRNGDVVLSEALEVTDLSVVRFEVLGPVLPSQTPAVEELRGWLHFPGLKVAVRQRSPLVSLNAAASTGAPQSNEAASLEAAVCETIRNHKSDFDVPDLLIAWQPMGLAVAECFADVASPRVSRTILVVPPDPDESWNLNDLAQRADRLLLATEVPGGRGLVAMGEGLASSLGSSQSPRLDDWDRNLLEYLIPALDLTGDFSSRDCKRERRPSCFKTALQQQVGLEKQPDAPLVLGVIDETVESTPAYALPQTLLEALTRVEADHDIKAQALVLLCGDWPKTELQGGQLERLARTFPDRVRVVKARPTGKESGGTCGRAFRYAARGADVAVDLSDRPHPGRLFAAVYGGAFPLMLSQHWLLGDFGQRLSAERLNADEEIAGTSSLADLYAQIRPAAKALARSLVLFSSRASSDEAFQVKQQLLLSWLGAVLAAGVDDEEGVIESWAEGFGSKLEMDHLFGPE